MKVFAKISLLAATMSSVLFTNDAIAQKTNDGFLGLTNTYQYVSLPTEGGTLTANYNAATSMLLPPDDGAIILKITPTVSKNLSTANSTSILIGFRNAKKNTVSIILRNKNSDVLFDKDVKDCKNFFESLNLKNLDYGVYNLTVCKNLIKTIQPFELTAAGVVMNEKKRVHKFIPQIIQRENKLDVNVMMTKLGSVNFSIYNSDGQLVFEERNDKVIMLNKRYDLMQLGRGEFTAEVSADDEVTYLEIKL